MSGLIGDRRENTLDEMIAFTQEFNEQCREEARLEEEKAARREARQKEAPKAPSKPAENVKKETKKEEPVKFTRTDSGLIVAAGGNVYCVEPGRKFSVQDDISPFFTLCLHDEDVYAGINSGEVFNLKTKKKVADFKGTLYDLCSHKGRLYATSYNDIYDALSGRKVQSRKGHVLALCSHKGTLYDAGYDKTIFSTLSDKFKVGTWGTIADLCSYNQALYYCGRFNGIFNTGSLSLKIKRKKSLRLCTHAGMLYSAGYDHAIYNTFTSKQIARRSHTIHALCSHDGKLYDGGEYNNVYDTLKDPAGTSPAWKFNDDVHAMISVPFNVWERIARKGKLEK